MDNRTDTQLQNKDIDKLKEIPKWSRRYAQNRTLTFLVLVSMAMLIAMFATVPVMLILAGGFLGNHLLLLAGVTTLVLYLWFYVSMLKKYGGKNKGLIDLKIDRWLYGKEGIVSTPQHKLSKKMKCLDIAIGIINMVCLIGSMGLGMSGYIPIKYLLPFMALFEIPFGIYQYYILSPRLGPVLLIFPILIAIHAILIIAGAPLYFTGTFAVPLNMFIPVIYNFSSLIIGHFYSRYALKKLKSLTHMEGAAVDGN